MFTGADKGHVLRSDIDLDQQPVINRNNLDQWRAGLNDCANRRDIDCVDGAACGRALSEETDLSRAGRFRIV